MTRVFSRPFLALAMLMLCLCGAPAIVQAQDSGTTPVLADKSPAAELAFWNSIKNSGKPEDYKTYLENFPDGMFYDNALVQFENAGGNKSDLSADTTTTKVKSPVTTTATKSTAVKTKKRPPVIVKKKPPGTAVAKTAKAKPASCRNGRNKDGSCIKKTKKKAKKAATEKKAGTKPKYMPRTNQDGKDSGGGSGGGESRGGGWSG